MPLIESRASRTRRPPAMPIALIGFAVVAAAVFAFFALLPEPPPPPPPPLPPLEIGWEPAVPSEGHLFLVRVGGEGGSDRAGGTVRPADSTDDDADRRPAAGTPPAMTSISGEAGTETLHFHPMGGSPASVAAVPVGARDSIEAWVRVEYDDGRSQVDTVRIPVAPVAYDHERLTVAPRFGSPLNEEDRARLDRDRARAAEVSRLARATPPLWSPAMVMPRSTPVTSEFGTGRVFNGQISSRHMGLDLRGLAGDTVRAAADGVVALADGFLLAGNIVYLNHGGGVVSSYSHLSAHLVAEGDTVTAGTPVGLVGATGRVTGAHLHWVVRYGSTSVDPRSLLTLLGETGSS